MRSLAGVCYFDSRPIGPGDRAMLLALADGDLAPHLAPGLAMLSGSGPDAHSGLCAFAGRLDIPKDTTFSCASELVLSLYHRKGPAAFHDLIGDWGVALWDARERAILLAGDYAGVRPLYYCRTPASLKWSSSLEHLLNWTGITSLDSDLDADFVAGMIAHACSPGKTPYRGIDCLQPGAFLRATRESFVTKRFWHPPIDSCALDGNEADYAERLRTLFQEAVAVRLGGAAHVSAELSGGMDSSSVVCMANRLAPGITTFSYHSPGTNDAPFISAVEEFCKNPGIHLDSEEFPPLTYACAGSAAPYFGAPRWAEVSRRMRRQGSGLLLTGQAGDLVMGNWLDDSEQAADYLRQGRVVSAVKEAFAWSQSLGVPVYPILWRALRPVDLAARSPAAHGCQSMAGAFRQRAESLDGAPFAWECPRDVPPSHRKRLWGLMNLLSSGTLRSPDTLAGAYTTHPFTHRPLVEFMLSAPSGFLCRPGEPRRLMRRALKGIVPDALLRRRSKGNYEVMFRRALRKCAVELLRDPEPLRLVELGYLEQESTQRRLEDLVQGLPCSEHQLRQVILCEVWLRRRRDLADDRSIPRKGYAAVA